MTPANVHFGLASALYTGASTLQKPTSGSRTDLGGRNFCLIRRWGSGTWDFPAVDEKLIGAVVFVVADAAQTYRQPSGTELISLASGQSALFEAVTTTTWAVLACSGASGPTGFIEASLTSWREVGSNDVPSGGGILATDTTPALQTRNGDTNGNLQLLWAATNQDPIVRSFILPPDLDRTRDMTLHVYGRTGTNDAPVIDVDTFFVSDPGGATGTKVEDATTAFGDANGIQTATIAAADIPDAAIAMSVELTPGAHGTDGLDVGAIWLTYFRKFA